MRTSGDVTGMPAEHAMPTASSKVDQGFSRERRIVRSADYQRIFSGDRRNAGRYQVLWVADGPSEVPRVGVVASKRTFRRAVDRARAKRLLREAFRLNRDRLARNTDCVLVARRSILDANRGDVERDLGTVARRCRVLRENGDTR
ncbi:MAG: ribonuclease P protein component [Kiritimatiellae bacterium]|nr:ribonuclease P protein component [Kiritimatiellia bacterium]